MTQQELTLAKTKGVAYISGFTADQISGFLKKKHDADLFVDQCKNGPTWSSHNLLILDAWVLKRTYSPLTTIGYEIKVSRHDFEQDQKWTGYLDLCHYFYFVCPAGLIRATDLPSHAGLMWVSQSGAIHVKHKPERLKPDPTKMNELLIYVLMARAVISNTYFPPNNGEELSRVDGRRKTVEEAAKRKELAYFVKGHIKQYEDSVRARESTLAPRETAVQEFVRRLADLGIVWNLEKNVWEEQWRVNEQISALKESITGEDLRQLEGMAQRLAETCKTIRKLRGEQKVVFG